VNASDDPLISTSAASLDPFSNRFLDDLQQKMSLQKLWRTLRLRSAVLVISRNYLTIGGRMMYAIDDWKNVQRLLSELVTQRSMIVTDQFMRSLGTQSYASHELLEG
jgi:hypothetical protein